MRNDHSQRIRRALREVRPLFHEDHEAVVALGLPIYESLVVAYLRAAVHLLGSDGGFSVMARDRAWGEWQAGIAQALEGALRFRENEPLLMAMGVLAALLPGVFPRAYLRGFKALDDALLAAQRSATAFKRERSRYRRRIRDMVTRVSVWVGPQGDIRRDADLSDADRAGLAAQGFRDRWGATFAHPRPDEVIGLVQAVLPVASVPSGPDTLAAPLF